MATNPRAVIVGASTLLGKEIIEELNTSQPTWDLRLADTTDSSGQLVAGGDEALVVQPITPEIFELCDVAFFAADAQITRAHWQEARSAGAAIIDVTSSLEKGTGAVVRSPWIASSAPRTITDIVIPAHPAAVMLGIVGSRLTPAFGPMHLAATVLEPASQQGSRGLDEMHQQTINLLSFHSLPQAIYDAQVAFNLRIAAGASAKFDMTEISATIRRHLTAIAGESIASAVSFQLVQAPVFHAYTMSIYAQLPASAGAGAIRKALDGGLVHLTAHEDAPTNQSIVEEQGIAIVLTEEETIHQNTRGFWLWMAADNLKLAARQAVLCAKELAASRTAKPQ